MDTFSRRDIDKLESRLATADVGLMDARELAVRMSSLAGGATMKEIDSLLLPYGKAIRNVHELGQAIRRRIAFGQMPRERDWTVIGIYWADEDRPRYMQTFKAESAFDAEQQAPENVLVAGVIEGDHLAADAVYA